MTWRFDVNLLAKIDGCIVELLIRRAAQRSKWLPWAWHLKQRNVFLERFAEKERLLGEVEP